MAITAQAVVDRIQKQLAPGWKESPVDTFMAGKPDTLVKGIATTYAPSLEMLHRAQAAGRNMIISRESPWWVRHRSQIRPGTGGFGPDTQPASAGQAPGAPDTMEKDPVYRAKRDFIAANNMVVYRLFDNWSARQTDAQLQGLARALGWEKYYRPSGGIPWARNNGFFEIPPATLKQTALNIKQTLKMKNIRVGGDPDITVRKVALSHGMYFLPDVQQLLAEPGVDLLVMGEPQWENEVCQYSFDLHAAGVRKGLVLLGQEVSEEPGSGEMAGWLRSFVKEVPVEWMSAGEPSWMPY